MSIGEMLACGGDPGWWSSGVWYADELQFSGKGFAADGDGSEEDGDALEPWMISEWGLGDEFGVKQRDAGRGEQQERGLVEVSEPKGAPHLRNPREVLSEYWPEFHWTDAKT